jgi:hypothetical protein
MFTKLKIKWFFWLKGVRDKRLRSIGGLEFTNCKISIITNTELNLEMWHVDAECEPDWSLLNKHTRYKELKNRKILQIYGGGDDCITIRVAGKRGEYEAFDDAMGRYLEGENEALVNEAVRVFGKDNPLYEK